MEKVDFVTFQSLHGYNICSIWHRKVKFTFLWSQIRFLSIRIIIGNKKMKKDFLPNFSEIFKSTWPQMLGGRVIPPYTFFEGPP